MLTAEENHRLTSVDADTPMGQMLRRYWVPAIQSNQLIAGGAPKAVKLLGENLVAFRGDDGAVGLLDEACPHRGASLVIARNVDCALICLYHGWKIAADGKILDMPAEPEGTRYIERVRQLAYPVREGGGFVWTYMGPADETPEFPIFSWIDKPAENILILQAISECNWVQVLEGAIDSAHQTYLHDSVSRMARDRAYAQRAAELDLEPTDGFDETGQVIRPWADGRPEMVAEDTDYGFKYAAVRKPLFKEDQFKNVRMTHYIAPYYTAIPSPPGWVQLILQVPMDANTTAFYHLRCSLEGPYDEATRQLHEEASGVVLGVDIDENFRRFANKSNLWFQDREEMKRDRFSGIRGTVVEDHAVQESMGAISDRTREHLGTSDLAIIRMRRILLRSLREFEESGRAPVGLRSPVSYRDLRGEERTVPIDTDWRTVGAPVDA